MLNDKNFQQIHYTLYTYEFADQKHSVFLLSQKKDYYIIKKIIVLCKYACKGQKENKQIITMKRLKIQERKRDM